MAICSVDINRSVLQKYGIAKSLHSIWKEYIEYIEVHIHILKYSLIFLLRWKYHIWERERDKERESWIEPDYKRNPDVKLVGLPLVNGHLELAHVVAVVAGEYDIGVLQFTCMYV